MGPDGNLWFTEFNRIGRITPLGVVTEFNVDGVPLGIAAGPDGNLWFTEGYAKSIGRMTPLGVVTEFSAGITPGAQLGDITAGPDGNMWFTESYMLHRIGRITTKAVSTPVVEFYHAAFDHYFITWMPDEIAKLDAGTQIRGWTRTGYSFKTYTTPEAGTSPVCRYYIPPGLGDSHFFGRGTVGVQCDGAEESELRAGRPGLHADVPSCSRSLSRQHDAGVSGLQQSSRRQSPLHDRPGGARSDGGEGMAGGG